jgi:hypothetical protein
VALGEEQQSERLYREGLSQQPPKAAIQEALADLVEFRHLFPNHELAATIFELLSKRLVDHL